MEPKTPCCNKPMTKMASGLYVICWNPLNGVVSCHICGAVYVPSEDDGRAVKQVWASVSPEAMWHVENGTAPSSMSDERCLIDMVHKMARDGVAPEIIEQRTGMSLEELAYIEARVLKKTPMTPEGLEGSS